MPNEQDIPHDLVLTTISHLSRASHENPAFERVIRSGLLMHMFSTNFTSLLVHSVDCVRQAVPSLDNFVRASLVSLIASTLKISLPDKLTGKSISTHSVIGAQRVGSAASEENSTTASDPTVNRSDEDETSIEPNRTGIEVRLRTSDRNGICHSCCDHNIHCHMSIMTNRFM